jgi:hypothetical protein
LNLHAAAEHSAARGRAAGNDGSTTRATRSGSRGLYRKRRGGSFLKPPLIRNPREGVVVSALRHVETGRSLAHRGDDGTGRTNREGCSRAVDWNGPQVQLAQGRLCRTAEKAFGHIMRERVFTSSCASDERGDLF